MQLSTLLFNEALTLGEKLSTGSITLVLGMLLVFIVMLIIMLVLMAIGGFFASKDKKKAEKPAKKEEAVETVPVSEVVPVPEAPVADEEIVAAITAAISVMMEAPVGSFRVVSFRKTTAKAAWNKK